MSLSLKFRGAAVVVAVAAMALTGCSSSDDVETTSATPTTSGSAAPALRAEGPRKALRDAPDHRCSSAKRQGFTSHRILVRLVDSTSRKST